MVMVHEHANISSVCRKSVGSDFQCKYLIDKLSIILYTSMFSIEKNIVYAQVSLVRGQGIEGM